MKSVVCVILLVTTCSMSKETSNQEIHHIKKRNIYQLAHVIQCAQERSSWHVFWALYNYNNYGCWCGSGGKGDPLDESDMCCFEHDNCYIRVRNYLATRKLNEMLRFTGVYHYRCLDNEILCDDMELWKRKLCLCDKMIAECLANNRQSYDKSKRGADSDGQCFYRVKSALKSEFFEDID
ncbi:basic phospholipase A2 3-like [Styela clava]